jgi:hypothetical protein
MLEAKEKPAAEAEGQRRANGTFEHGHQLSVGNRGGMATRVRRDFISHCLIVKLHESIQRQSDGRFMKGIENLVKQFERGDLAVIKFVTERFEGVLPIDLTISGPNGGPVKTITATMSAEEAEAVYAATFPCGRLDPASARRRGCGQAPRGARPSAKPALDHGS